MTAIKLKQGGARIPADISIAGEEAASTMIQSRAGSGEERSWRRSKNAEMEEDGELVVEIRAGLGGLMRWWWTRQLEGEARAEASRRW
ncbi:hypothetical protein M0R45_002361 [Rubus argutus]|uniref:Uncharacterized protein n=1 Tax=Rubus argutus TaxID=59490 RepID=A0AAW1VH20_RUBAR